MGLSKVVGSNRLDKRRYSMLMARDHQHMWPNNNGCLVGFSPIDSMIWWVNFKVKFSNQAENYSKTVYFYQKLVVNPGRHLDYVHSIGKTGRLP